MDNQQSHQPEGHISPSRPRMLGLTEMLNHNSTESSSMRPSQPAYYNQHHAPSQFQSSYVSLADHMRGPSYSYSTPYIPPASHPNPRHNPRSRTTSRSYQPGHLPQLPPFPGTESSYYGPGDTTQRSNRPNPYLPPYYYYSAPQYRPDYTMSHGAPGTYNPYLPPQPQPPPAAVPGQYLPPGPNFQNQLPLPNVTGYVRPPPGSSGIQLPPLDSSQPNSNVTPQRKTCNLCLDHLDLSPSNFPFKCPQCNLSQYCSACLKSWFLDACKNESKMPPKCCSIIPLSAVKKLMTVEEMALYKSKLEEWMTPGKLYCPVPTCSTFIPPRLYQKPAKKGFVQIDHSTVDDRNPVTADSQTQPSTDVKVGVACPKCSVQICTDCHSFTHNGHCREDLDPALVEQLKKWKIKRCPRCRTGVRKVYGCSHIECRCGAHFCWQCMQPADQCEGSCDDDQQDDSGVESDDVDGLAGYYDGDGHEFGPEPENEYTIGWNCQHRLAVPGYAVPEGAECHRCFRNIVQDAPEATQDATAEVEENGGERDTQLAWQCFRCFMMFCQDCREEIESR